MLLSLHILQLLYFATRIATLIRVMGYMDNNQRQMLLVKGSGEIICFKEYNWERKTYVERIYLALLNNLKVYISQSFSIYSIVS